MTAELVDFSKTTDCGIVIGINRSITAIIDLWCDAWKNKYTNKCTLLCTLLSKDGVELKLCCICFLSFYSKKHRNGSASKRKKHLLLRLVWCLILFLFNVCSYLVWIFYTFLWTGRIGIDFTIQTYCSLDLS